MKREDVAPPYTAVARHGVFPEPKHDEAARFNFLANLNKYLSGALGPGNQLAYERRVFPAFQKEHGRAPKDRFEIRAAMNKDPYHRFWSALKRNSMEMRQQNGRAMVLRQLDELDAKARQYNEGRETLELNPDVEVPRYQAAVDIHCMPGSYHGEERPGDVSAGANYDCGIFATTAGGLGALSDGGGQALVEWIRKERPGWVPRRILDIGVTIGHNAVPLALAFPESEIVAIDTAAPALRYGHARAQSLAATEHPLRPGQCGGSVALAGRAFRLGADDDVPSRDERQGASEDHERASPSARAGRADAASRAAAIFGKHAALRAIHPRLGRLQQQ
jgi:hypothetical protein